MRGAQILTAVTIGAVTLISGCGQQHPAAAGNPGAPSAHPTDAPRCPGGQTAWHGSKLTITAADNGRSFCVTRGTAVIVALKAATPGSKWAPVHASSGALAPHANGELTAAIGVTGASFIAVQPGTAIITSSRPACGPGVPPGDGASGTGTLECDAIIDYHVTVTVAR